MTVTAKVIADSIGQEAPRLTTMELRYPRFIHSEFMTHRVFSRNASSSRAIPVAKMIEEIRRNPALPEKWVRNEPGMQGYREAPAEISYSAQTLYIEQMHSAIHYAKKLIELGLHKQHINRLLEPWMHIKVVVTGTQWKNFLELRMHPTAEPTMQALANAVNAAFLGSTPEYLERGQWHLPYIDPETRMAVEMEINGLSPDSPKVRLGKRAAIRQRLRAVSAARCARVSYNNFEGKKSTWKEDLDLCAKLSQQPLHASPFEHQATPDWMQSDGLYRLPKWSHPAQHGNLVGWVQFRKLLPGENLDAQVSEDPSEPTSVDSLLGT